MIFLNHNPRLNQNPLYNSYALLQVSSGSYQNTLLGQQSDKKLTCCDPLA